MSAARSLLRLAVAMIAMAVLAPAAQASFSVEVLDHNGNPEARAGAHPDRIVTRFPVVSDGEAQEAKEMVIEYPPGMGGDPNAVPACPRMQFEAFCPPESQVGVLITVSGEPGMENTERSRVFSIEPAPGEVLALGVFQSFLRPKLIGRLRAGDYGFTVAMGDLFQPSTSDLATAANEIRFELWGVPADHQEDTALPRRAFLTTPTRCDTGPFSVTTRMRTWQEPERWNVERADTGLPTWGCGELSFRPRMEFGFENPVVDSPTGAEITITTNPSDDPDARVESHTRSSSVAMPPGTALSLGAAKRFAICTDAQFGLGQETAPSCPPASRIGTLEADAPQLAERLSGAIYIGEERPGDRFRIFASAEGAGTQVKLVGSLRTDPQTGRLTTVLENLPELPFGQMTMRFDGGPQALLVSPIHCGVAGADATFVPYSGSGPVFATDTVEVRAAGGAPCRGRSPFAPGFVAGGSSTKAGKGTAVSLSMLRRDGEQLPDRFGVTFPEGLTASLGQVQPCPAPQAASGSCPAASRVGSAVAEIGSGGDPAVLGGDIYMTGPYRGAPFGMAMVFAAKLGPFDLGRFTIRSAVGLDPLTGQVTVQTDPLPQTFEGVPLRFQTMGLDIDRAGFMRNPTSCAPAVMEATILSTEGAVVAPTTPFNVSGCVGLPFRPSFSLALTEPSQLHRGGRPGLRIRVRSRAGSANLRSADLGLPGVLELDSGAVAELCSRPKALAGTCPPRSRVGTAKAHSPLLDEPMRGGIFVAQPKGGGEPDLWTNLGGRGLELNARSEAATVDGRLHTRLAEQADMPFSLLTMRFAGGRNGLFTVTRDLCVKGTPRRLRGDVNALGHNGARFRAKLPVAAEVNCGG